MPCLMGAPTASGLPLDHNLPIFAVAAPTNMPVKATWVKMRLDQGPCRWLILADKMNPRYIGERGYDLTPAALRTLGVTPTKHWSGKLTPCLSHNFYKPYQAGVKP